MLRNLSVASLLTAVISLQVLQASAQEWAAKMLSEKSYDFGTVARGADAVHKFAVKNNYEEDIRLTNARSTCGCTLVSIEDETIKTGETGYVLARFNTSQFTGSRSATLTVNIGFKNKQGRSYSTEVQLRVYGKIRSDIVFSPGSVQFENIDQGTKLEQKISVTYAGRSSWEINDVKSTSKYYEVELIETNRQLGRVSYDLIVRLKDNAPAGFLKDQLILVTNDQHNMRIPLDIEGRIIPEISVSPQPFVLGEIPQGERVTKTLVVRGKTPFKITGVDCAGGCLTFDADKESKKLHIVKVTFHTGQVPPGQVKQAIHISTDCGHNVGAKLTVYATIVQGEKQEATVEEDQSASTDDTSDNREAARYDTHGSATTTADTDGKVKADGRWRPRNELAVQ